MANISVPGGRAIHVIEVMAMNDFEKACHIENYTGDSTQENVVEWIRGDKEVTVTLSGRTKYNSKVRKLAEQFPDEVKIVSDNIDGSIVAHLPLSYIKISHPRQVNLTDEQKEMAAERLRTIRERQ